MGRGALPARVPSAERVTHSAAMLQDASSSRSRSAQRSGCSSIAIPSPS
jgi:hypothetical protein